jgi:hypothetical protein
MIIEWIALCLLVCLAFVVLWFVAAEWHYGDPDWFRHVFIGSLVGVAAAPWIWLHFSRDLTETTDESSPAVRAPDKARADAEQSDAKRPTSDATNRYQFLTIALGILLVVTIFGPALYDFLSRSNKVEAFGVSISSPEHASTSGNSVFAPNAPQNQGSSASAKLTGNTGAARTIGNPVMRGGLGGIRADLAGFEELSTVDRDRGFIAYFLHAAKLEDNPLLQKEYGDLESYVDDVEREESSKTDPLREINDTHLYFLDTSLFLKQLAILLNQITSEQTPPERPATLKDFLDKRTEITGPIRDVLRRSGSRWDSKKDPDPCDPSQTKADALPPNGETPYPALLALYSLAAVDSPESGMLYLSKWIAHAESSQRQKEQTQSQENGTIQSPPLRLSWYLLRAKINLSQIAAKVTKTLMEPERQVLFQRRMTDEYAELLRTKSPRAWRRLCDRLASGDLHARMGTQLAFTFATERNYLFELEEPTLVQAWRMAGRSELTGHLQQDLAEATAYVDTPECFARYPNFARNRDAWLGQFKLNVAQLRIDLLPARPQSEIAAEAAEIKKLLDRAAADLGPATLPALSDKPIDQLLGSADFDDQRPRVQLLQSIVAKFLLSP